VVVDPKTPYSKRPDLLEQLPVAQSTEREAGREPTAGPAGGSSTPADPIRPVNLTFTLYPGRFTEPLTVGSTNRNAG
jgi:hypothetical protein